MTILVDKGQAVSGQRGRLVFGKIQLQINFGFICCIIGRPVFLVISNSESIVDLFVAEW
jgi:hypothetical protein